MAMTKALGTTLQTGVTASGITGVHEQSATKSAGGELKVYKNREGTDISVYATDTHVEYSFEAILESSVQDKSIGDTTSITVGNTTVNGVVQKWDVTETNDDVKKVSIAIRTFPDISSSSSST